MVPQQLLDPYNKGYLQRTYLQRGCCVLKPLVQNRNKLALCDRPQAPWKQFIVHTRSSAFILSSFRV